MKVGIVVEFEAKLLKSSIFKVKVVKVQLDVFLMHVRMYWPLGKLSITPVPGKYEERWSASSR